MDARWRAPRFCSADKTLRVLDTLTGERPNTTTCNQISIAVVLVVEEAIEHQNSL